MQECRTPFGAKSFYDHEGLPYCETHFHARRGSLCVTCNQPVTGRCVTAMYRKYHPEHFVCTYCQRQLNKGTFKEQNNKPYCQQCFSRLFSWRLSFCHCRCTVCQRLLRHIPRLFCLDYGLCCSCIQYRVWHYNGPASSVWYLANVNMHFNQFLRVNYRKLQKLHISTDWFAA